jgi:hypothetical protein
MSMRAKTIVLLLLLPVTAIAYVALHKPPAKANLEQMLREGDLVFQHINSPQSAALELATGSYWTHVGIAFKQQDRWMVLEAVGPVKATPLKNWLAQGDGGRCVAKRWKELDAQALTRLRASADRFMGLPYDLGFLWSDERIYCSELVWKMYQEGLGVRLCEPKAMRDHDLQHDLVRRTMLERYGTAVPWDEPMIAPATLFDCPLLRTVAEV